MKIRVMTMHGVHPVRSKTVIVLQQVSQFNYRRYDVTQEDDKAMGIKINTNIKILKH